MAFRKWLEKQIKTLPLVEQDFAEDVLRDKNWVEPGNLPGLLEYLRSKGAYGEILSAATEAFNRWQVEDPKARIDGLGAKDKERIRKATRQVWSWSYPRKLCLQRATDHKGFYRCEQCKTRVPRIHVDHIKPVGKVDRGYIDRLFCPSTQLQALCNECHKPKTKAEAAARAAKARIAKGGETPTGVSLDTPRKKRNFTDLF